MNKRKGLFVLEPDWCERIYSPLELDLLRPRVDFSDRCYSPNEVRENPELLGEVEMLFSGWYGPRLDAAFLDAAPKLKAVFFGGGSIRQHVGDEFWERDVLLTAAASANAVPVAEFTLAQIILSLKRAWTYTRDLQRTRLYPGLGIDERKVPGTYGSTVGLVSLGMIGRRVREMLRLLDVQVIAYDPFLSPATAAELGVTCVSLEELFRRSDVVSLHTPLLAETQGFITGRLMALMKPKATLINTARGALINEPEMIEVLRSRPDLCAVLDVTWPEPPDPDSPLFTLPNVVLTPHIAGSIDGECRRLGSWMIEEAGRFLNNEPLRWGITREQAAILA